MSRYRVVVTDQVFPDIEVERALLKEIDAGIEVPGGGRDGMLAAAADADALLNTFAPLSADDIAGLGRCKVVARYGIGVDNIDLDAARAAGITVTNVPDYCIEEVAAHALTFLLALHRRLPAADASARRGGWGVGDLGAIGRLSDLTVGLVGYGQIARRFARMLRGLDTTIVAHDPYLDADPGDGTRLVAFDELLSSADVVSLHCPLTPATRGIVSRDELALMRSDATLINTSRGPLVVLDDLLQALRDGTIGGAGLDVFEQEPPDATAFEGVPNLIVTPHMAFYSTAAIRESQTKAATQVRKVLTGEPPDYGVN